MNHSTPGTRQSRIEARLFRGYWDDGQLDIFFGAGAVGVGLCWTAGLIPLGAVIPAVLAVFWTPVRRAVVEPRAGRVEFSDTRAAGNRRMLLGAVGVGAVVLALVALAATTGGAGTAQALDDAVAGLPAILIGVMACLVAAALRIARFLGYAAVFVLAGGAVGLWEKEPEVAILIGGAAATASGAWLLVRFFRRTRHVGADR